MTEFFVQCRRSDLSSDVLLFIEHVDVPIDPFRLQETDEFHGDIERDGHEGTEGDHVGEEDKQRQLHGSLLLSRGNVRVARKIDVKSIANVDFPEEGAHTEHGTQSEKKDEDLRREEKRRTKRSAVID